jgi:hypothetical protein
MTTPWMLDELAHLRILTADFSGSVHGAHTRRRR